MGERAHRLVPTRASLALPRRDDEGSLNDTSASRGPDSCDLGPRCGAELGEDVADVAVGGAFGDDEAFCNLTIRQAFGDQASHLPLASAQRSGIRWGRLRSNPRGA